MSGNDHGWTTASIEAVPRFDGTRDPTPGFVLVYSRLHEQLPSALALASTPTTVGREADNSLAIPEAAVSRYHARVEQRPSGWWIIDNGSTNGTLVNGVRIDGPALLADHDIIRIGDTLLRYASSNVYAYSAHRIDGTVIESARVHRHGIVSPLLVGGYQVNSVLDRIARVTRTGLSVVIAGESGTGKELVAQELHRQSGRSGPFQAINCAALPANLIETELFGHKKGAFTGAVQDKVGLVRAAHLGTLFLDEIGDMPLEAQSKLLRVLQEREVTPIGATQAEPVDVRIVTATHRDLDAFVAAGRFRGDLLARLCEVRVHLPPLRERREDLLPLVRHFLRRSGRPDARPRFSFMLALAHYEWPYNVRELESAVKLAIALADQPELDLVHLPENIQRALSGHGSRHASLAPSPPEDPGPAPPGTPSEDELRALLARHRGNIAAVGRALGKERMQVHRWLKRYAIDVNDFRQ
jgi:DNA-binding NtrC family response regulator